MSQPYLQLWQGSTQVVLEAGSISIGRDPNCDIVIDSPVASYRHADIRGHATQWDITDLGSTNGTQLDGQRVDAPSPLYDGATITIADVAISVRIGPLPDPSAAALTPPPAPSATQTPDDTYGGDLSRFARILRLPAHGEFVIGRDPACDYPLANPNVSWRHAAISTQDGIITLRDLGSRNGTLLNGQFVRSDARVIGDAEITVGPFALKVEAGTIVPLAPSSAVLEARGIDYLVDKKIATVDFTVGSGELVAVIGESGAGKTTLLRIITADVAPIAGTLLLGGAPVEKRRWDIGYVPQHDIVHASLTVSESLHCAARLRLPPDQAPKELQGRLDAVMTELDIKRLEHKRNDRISGGQRKRVSVATELLGDPRLLVLDEPTTGLDPLWDRRMMEVLRRRASNETSVVFVTHTTKWLKNCDRVLVMARGGGVVFNGSPDEALTHFDVTEHDEIYRRLEEASRSQIGDAQPPARPASIRRTPRSAAPTVRSASIASRALLSRDLRLYLGDKKNALARPAGVVAAALLLTFVFGTDVFAHQANDGHVDVTKSAQILFAALFVVTMFATGSAARDLVRERAVFYRERALGVPVAAYALSKLFVLGAVAIAEAGVLFVTLVLVAPLHASSAAYVQLGIIFALTALAGVAAGLTLSSFVRTEAQAASMLSFMFVPQLLLAGAIVSVQQMGLAEYLAYLMPIRWAYAGSGSALSVGERAHGQALQPAAGPDRGFLSFYGDSFFAISFPAVAAILVASVVLLTAALVWRLRSESEQQP